MQEDFLNLSEVVRDFPEINELPLSSNEEYEGLLKTLQKEQHSVPLFVKDTTGFIHVISPTMKLEIEKGFVLMYMGKPIKAEQLFNEFI